MDNLQVNKTDLTPYVDFNSETRMMKMEGSCIPENSHVFFVPIIKWIDELFADSSIDKNDEYELNITCEYYNSSSAKMFVYLFDKIAEIQKDGYQLKVVWNCFMDDPDLVESIEDFVSITNAAIEIRQI